MNDVGFDFDAYLNRVRLAERPVPGLAGLAAVVTAHAATFPFENLDVLLGRTPRLDAASLQAKLLGGRRGGYCFELNGLLRLALEALGFAVRPRIARVVRGGPAEAGRPATHMALEVHLPEGVFLADCGFGNLTATAPLALREGVAQATPHGRMRFRDVGGELALEAWLGAAWEPLYRLCPQQALDADYEVGNWFTATHPASPFVGNLIAARPGADGVRHSFLNGRVGRRAEDLSVAWRQVEGAAETAAVLADVFGLEVAEGEVAAALERLATLGRLGEGHPAFG